MAGSSDKLDATSEWQYGPKFLTQPIEEWPIRNDCSVKELPEESKVILLVEKGEPEIIDIERFSKFSRLIRTTARILNIKNSYPKRSLTYIGKDITVELFESAINYWSKICQNTIKDDLEKAISGKGRFKGLNILKCEDEVFIVKGRTGAWNQLSYNEDIVILPKGHRTLW